MVKHACRQAPFFWSVTQSSAANDYTCLLLQAQSIQFDDRPPVRYDVLSIDVGITPSTQGVPGVMEHAIPVKPVSRCAQYMPWTIAAFLKQHHMLDYSKLQIHAHEQTAKQQACSRDGKFYLFHMCLVCWT